MEMETMHKMAATLGNMIFNDRIAYMCGCDE
jgi:hypothetical protein